MAANHEIFKHRPRIRLVLSSISLAISHPKDLYEYGHISVFLWQGKEGPSGPQGPPGLPGLMVSDYIDVLVKLIQDINE